MSICSKCNKKVSPRAIQITCHDCGTILHGSCVNMTKEDVEFYNSGDNGVIWRCKPCSIAKRDSMIIDSKCDNGELTLVDLKILLDNILEKQNNMEKDLGGSLNSYAEELRDISKKFFDQNESLKIALTRIENLELENSKLKKDLKILQESELDLQQYTRSNNLEIHGFPEEKNECLGEIIKTIGNSINVPITEDMIDVCHRLRKNPNYHGPRGIIVRFVRRSIKDSFLKGRKIHRDLSTRHLGRNDDIPIYIRENLAPGRRKLFLDCRELNKSLHFKFLWTRNGSIYIRRDENSPVIPIRNMEDFKLLEKKYLDISKVIT